MLIGVRAHLKGILHQKIFYRLNLIFWIVMGRGIADFDQRGPLRREVPCGAASRGPWGQNENPKMLSFGGL